MDKLVKPRTSKLFLAGLFFLATGAFAPNDTPAQTLSWSFSLHPHPYIEQMTSKEHGFSVALSGPVDFVQRCELSVLYNYQIYNTRYPDFQQTGEKAANFLNWQIHMVAPPERFAATCIIGSAFRAVNYLVPSSNYYYCGQYSRSPLSDDDHALQKGLSELLAFANTGSLFAIKTMLIVNDEIPELVILNPDVEFYFSQLAINHWTPNELAFNGLTKLLQRTPNISDERKAFVEQAAENLDLQSVLDTTEPCAPKN